MEMNKCYKLLLADDHILLRDALAKLINAFENFSVEAVASDGKELIEHVKNNADIKIILTDLSMPHMDGFDAVKWLYKNRPDINILVLTMYDSDVSLIRLLQAGVKGFLKKDIHPEELETALLKVAKGDYYYKEEENLKIISLFKQDNNEYLPIESVIFNEQEIEFIKLSSTDKTYREIAKLMGLNARYLEGFRQKMFIKLNVKTRIGLAIYAMKKGIIIYSFTLSIYFACHT